MTDPTYADIAKDAMWRIGRYPSNEGWDHAWGQVAALATKCGELERALEQAAESGSTTEAQERAAERDWQLDHGIPLGGSTGIGDD